jgi:hypothetical protein
MPRKKYTVKPRELLDDYHGLLLEMRYFCEGRGLSFRDGMMRAVAEWMQRNGYENIEQECCNDATGGLGLDASGRGSREAAKGAQPCASKSKSRIRSRLKRPCGKPREEKTAE